jgi:hypothetical protein
MDDCGCELPGQLQFSKAASTVAENGGTATITINRSGGSNGAVAVHYATSNGTATAGIDYTAEQGTLTFADGQISNSFTVPILNDPQLDGNETVNLTLTGPTGGATLGSPSTAVLTIQETPTITATGATVSQGEGTPFNGVIATFTDANPTATAGDYTASITWGDGNTTQSDITS